MADKIHNTASQPAEASATADVKSGGKTKLEPPKVITYSGDDILEELGPAHACNPFSGSVVAC